MKRFLTLALALCMAAGGTGLASAKSIKIGLMAPMTGSWASEGQDMKQIVELLAKDINDKGGINGDQIEILVEDDGGDPRTASLAAQRLATQGVVAVVGTYGSSVTEASQTIYDDFQIPQVANGSTAVRLTEKGLKYFFRTCPRDDEQGRVAAGTLEKMGFKKVAVLHDNTSYAKGLAEETMALLKDKGIEVVFSDALTPGERDYNAILTKMKSAGPEAVFFTGYYPEAGLLLRQKMEMNWNVPFLGGDATNNPDLVKIAGNKAAEGFYFLSPPVPQDLPAQKAKDFLAAYQKKYGAAPGSIWAVLAGDGFLAVTAAIEGAKSTKPDDLADYMHKKMKDAQGLTGTITFNDKGDRVGEVYKVYKVDAEGKFVLQP
ncbi:branched chain amino acid ABC transporter substrate-binding protein [Desulfuromonas versatilis]|uniref:Branched chain amino acid ABC transporter substrate-binding protein n=1 Tax=Desulfuromonas versatilis TaxID=2802975 RepID=A0ABM8HXJ5_9BACT|nr:branched-chain amino acid ABC transporter substrate-binding protein [Desulfuromonas versatilis]BCR05830.1 branched chain amino acid ABC transporter substrate-binding protein [Desulfuromonas versatilis]